MMKTYGIDLKCLQKKNSLIDMNSAEAWTELEQQFFVRINI